MSEFNILIADDDPGIRHFLRRGLQLEGYDVIEADSGALAVELANASKPNLVILDWMMPGMDGPETLRQIRVTNATMPIIFLTGRGGSSADGFALGADDYFEKPVSFAQLVERLRTLLPSVHLMPKPI
jgi:DNA-binding response OmpR family regulator